VVLADLIAPVSADEFLARHFEQTYLHLKGEPTRFSSLFSLQEIDSWLAAVRSGPPDSIIITSPEGAEVSSAVYRPRDITVDLVHEAFVKGSSIVVNHLEDWPPLVSLVKGLGREFLADVGVNAYLTPKGARTFPIHTDEHDAFILHLQGEKIWHLHEFSLLQLRLSQKKHLKFPAEWYGRTKTPELAEIRLRPGDVLYIPRGMPHYAVAQESAALHLTVSITPLYWMDVIKMAAEVAALHSQEVRRALAPGFVESAEARARMRAQFPSVMKAFQEFADFDEVLAMVVRNRVVFQDFPVDGQFAQMLRLEGLTAASWVERRRDVLCSVDEIFDIARKPKMAIFFGNRQVSGPRHLKRALEFIRDHRSFQVGKIPGLDEPGQVTLARRLLAEGLLHRLADEPVTGA
jgi:bifunctional lysine-specific demethylase and histidyl-hydroxylase NO66